MQLHLRLWWQRHRRLGAQIRKTACAAAADQVLLVIRYNFAQEQQPEKKPVAFAKIKKKTAFKPITKLNADEGIKFSPAPPSINELINPMSGVMFVQGMFNFKTYLCEF